MTVIAWIREHAEADNLLGDLAYALEDVPEPGPADLFELRALAEANWGTLPGSARAACRGAWQEYKRAELGYAGGEAP